MRKWRIEEWEMFPTKGSEKEMTETTVVVDETTETVDVTEAPSYLDSEGTALVAGSFIRVSSDQAESHWDEDREEYVPARDFDFGDVVKLNEDGTVQVAWNSAGCGCGGASSRTENSSELTLSTESEVEVYYYGYQKGRSEGKESVQQDLRYALGLPENLEDLLDNQA